MLLCFRSIKQLSLENKFRKKFLTRKTFVFVQIKEGGCAVLTFCLCYIFNLFYSLLTHK